MQEMAPRFSKFFGGGRGGGGGGACRRTPLANCLASLGRSFAALGRAPRIITLQSIFETWQTCVSKAFKPKTANQPTIKICHLTLRLFQSLLLIHRIKVEDHTLSVFFSQIIVINNNKIKF